MKKIIAISLFVLLITSSMAFANPSLLVEDKYPTVNEGTMVSIVAVMENPPYTLYATYRPNSATSMSKTVGQLNTEGRINWKPQVPGLADLVLKDGSDKKIASQLVAVKYQSTPASGVAIMFLAGLLLFGGAAFSLKRALGL